MPDRPVLLISLISDIGLPLFMKELLVMESIERSQLIWLSAPQKPALIKTHLHH